MPLSKEDFFAKTPPKPLTVSHFGAIHTFIEISLQSIVLAIPDNSLHHALMLKDLIRQHFIHLGGDPKELAE